LIDNKRFEWYALLGIRKITVEFEQLANTEAVCATLYQCWNFRNEGTCEIYDCTGCKVIHL